MRKSLITSFAIHGALLAAALVVLPNPEAFKVKPQDSIQVDISNIGNESKREATSKTAEKKVEKAAPKKAEVVKKVDPAPKVAEEIKTAAKEPTAEPPPPEPKKVEPKKEPEPPKKVEEPKPLDPTALSELLKKVEEPPPEPKKEKPKKEEVKKAEVKPEKKPDKKKPEKKKPEFNPDAIAELLLNKTDEEKTAPQQPTEVAGNPEKAEVDVQGNDDAISATIVDALVSKVKACFTVPPAARDADISVRVKFSLNQDGSVASEPQILNPSSDPVTDATGRAAVSAILECQNYELPQDRYDLWKENTLDFNPTLLFGT
jgi:outer membrane biosynthesis protein TonB